MNVYLVYDFGDLVEIFQFAADAQTLVEELRTTAKARRDAFREKEPDLYHHSDEQYDRMITMKPYTLK